MRIKTGICEASFFRGLNSPLFGSNIILFGSLGRELSRFPEDGGRRAEPDISDRWNMPFRHFLYSKWDLHAQGGKKERSHSARPHEGDEGWQLSKDSADAATARAACRRKTVGRQGERKKRNRNRNRGSPVTGYFIPDFAMTGSPAGSFGMSRRGMKEPYGVFPRQIKERETKTNESRDTGRL